MCFLYLYIHVSYRLNFSSVFDNHKQALLEEKIRITVFKLTKTSLLLSHLRGKGKLTQWSVRTLYQCCKKKATQGEVVKRKQPREKL